MEDHAMFQYYINTLSTKGWKVKPELWNALLDRVKNMVIEVRRETRKNFLYLLHLLINLTLPMIRYKIRSRK